MKKIIAKKAKELSESDEDEEAQFKIVKKKVVPSQVSQNSIKIITRKITPKPKTATKIKPVVLESDDDINSPPPTELKTKSSVFDRLGVGDVSSTTPNFDSNNAPSSDSRKVRSSEYFLNF